MALIELDNVFKTYRFGHVELPILKGVSFQIERGEMVALMGSSGSGKSTLMNILACLDRPTSGKYWLEGEEVSQLNQNRRAELRNEKIGFVFQNFSLLARTSALDNVLMPLIYATRPGNKNQERDRAVHLLEQVGLGDRLDHEPTQLSGGQQQRVAIARALINNPSLIFADEPTGNLDSKTSDEMLAMFQELNRAEGITIVIVTHEADVAGKAQRIIRLRDGQILTNTSEEAQL